MSFTAFRPVGGNVFVQFHVSNKEIICKLVSFKLKYLGMKIVSTEAQQDSSVGVLV